MAFTLCTSGAAIVKAGNQAATLTISQLNNFSDEAESIISATARYDVVTNFGSLTTNGKQLLQQLSSDMIAQSILEYNTSNIDTREAELRLDIMENRIVRGLRMLEDENVQAFLGINQ